MNLNLIKNGVIHVGASEGQERDEYNNKSLNVLWIEPIPNMFDRLKHNIINYKKQEAFNYLVTDVDDIEYDFYLSNNDGHSSSIYDLHLHKQIWPDVSYTDVLKLKSKTLTTIIKDNNIDITKYDYLVLDTQGSELLVLKGAVDILKNFEYISLEVANFESYVGCCQLSDVDTFFNENGFERIELKNWWSKNDHNVGTYFDATYKRILNK